MEITEKNDVPSFKKLFKRDILNFQLMGMWSMSDIFSTHKIKINWWENVFIFTTIIILDAIEIFQVNAIYKIYNKQLNYAIQLFGLTCTGVLSTIKIIRLWTYRSELYELLQTLGVMWEFAHARNFISKKIASIAERTRRMTNYYTLVLGLSILDYVTYPYISIIKYQLNKDINSTYDFTNLVLPVDYWFSIDSYSIYFICVTHQQVAVVITVVSWVASDTLFVQLTTHVTLQLMILANNLKAAIENPDNLKNKNQMNKKLGDVAKKYQQLYLYCRLIETVFNPIIFFTVVSNAMNICSSMYRLDQEITAKNVEEISKQVFYLLDVSFQTAVFCMFAESLSASSTLISDTIYQSQWTNCDHKTRMILLMIMVRAQKGFKCTAYGIIDLNHNQLKQIANASVSYFMLLRNFS